METVANPSRPPSPSLPKAGKWAFALTMLSALGLLQVVFGAIMFGAFALINGLSFAEFGDMAGDLIETEIGILLGVGAYFCAALSVILLAYGWGSTWAVLTENPVSSSRDWLAWYPLQGIKLWAIPPLTLLFIVTASQTVNQLIGSTLVDAQALLFSTPLLQIVVIPVAGILGPLAEELVFRGALYNALLPEKREGRPAWLRHLLPYLVTTVAFVMIHAYAGFESIGSYILLFVLSGFLGLLRATTGSVKAAIAGHMTSNLASVAGLIVAQSLGIAIL